MPDIVLGFDTSAAHCAAAVVCGDRVLAQRLEPMTKGQAERLFPLLIEVLAQAEIGWADLTAIGVGTGPGNFTGVRISVAAARGLALSLGIPAVGVSVTEAVAMDCPRPCRAIFPARVGEVIWQDFGATHSGASHADDTPAQSPQDMLPPGPSVAEPTWPLAVAIARIAAERAKNPATPRPAPIYLRPADAAPPRDPAPAILP